MQATELHAHLIANNIHVSEAIVQQYLADCGIEPTSILSPKEVAVFMEDLEAKQSALAVAAPTSAIAPTKPKSTKGGNLTKAQLQEQLEAARQQLARQSAPVQQVQGYVSTQVQDAVMSGIQAYVQQSEGAIDQGAAALAQYNATALPRLWAAVEVKQNALGILDPTESILAQQRASNESMVSAIANAINKSNENLGISGMGFDV